VTVLALYAAVEPGQPVAGLVVVEPLGAVPHPLGVAFLATAFSELAVMRIVSGMARRTRGTESEEGPVECAVLSLECAYVRRIDQPRLMAIATLDGVVSVDQLEPDGIVVERVAVESHQCKVLSEVILVTVGAVLPSHGGVEPTPFGNTGPQRLVAFQALVVRDTPLAQRVAVGAFAQATQVTVHGGELAGRQQLGRRCLRVGKQSNR
jgi:hypothetical protein